MFISNGKPCALLQMVYYGNNKEAEKEFWEMNNSLDKKDKDIKKLCNWMDIVLEVFNVYAIGNYFNSSFIAILSRPLG